MHHNKKNPQQNNKQGGKQSLHESIFEKLLVYSVHFMRTHCEEAEGEGSSAWPGQGETGKLEWKMF